MTIFIALIALQFAFIIGALLLQLFREGKFDGAIRTLAATVKFCGRIAAVSLKKGKRRIVLMMDVMRDLGFFLIVSSTATGTGIYSMYSAISVGDTSGIIKGLVGALFGIYGLSIVKQKRGTIL